MIDLNGGELRYGDKILITDGGNYLTQYRVGDQWDARTLKRRSTASVWTVHTPSLETWQLTESPTDPPTDLVDLDNQGFVLRAASGDFLLPITVKEACPTPDSCSVHLVSEPGELAPTWIANPFWHGRYVSFPNAYAGWTFLRDESKALAKPQEVGVLAVGLACVDQVHVTKVWLVTERVARGDF